MTLQDELLRRISFLTGVGFQEAPPRYIAFLDWLEKQPATRDILSRLRESADMDAMCASAGPQQPPNAATPEDVARIGLYFFEHCKMGNDLPGLFFGLGLYSKWGTSHLDGYFASAIDTYIQPFINFLLHEIEKLDEQLSAEDVATFRTNMILSDSFAAQFPSTSSRLIKLSKELFALDHSENWYNASNSCRELIKGFSSEAFLVLSEDIPDDTKAGDVKNLLKYLVSKRHPSGRTKETLCDLIGSVWDHTQCLLHRGDTTKEEAMRIYLWTTLLISEIYELVKK